MKHKLKPNALKLLRDRIYIIMAVIGILVLASSYLIFKNEQKTILAKEEAKIEKTLSLMKQFIADEVTLVAQDLEFFSRNPAYANYLDGKEKENERAISATLKTYGEIRDIYLAIDIVDLQLSPKLTIDFSNLNSSSLDTAQWFTPDWVKLLPNLQQGEIFVGSIDLFRRNKEIAAPIKPYVPFVIPIYKNGEKKGYVINYYRAFRLLDKMAFVEEKSDLDIAMTTNEGLWIKGFRPEEGFSHILHPEQQKSAKTQYQSLWETICKSESHLISVNYGVLGCSTISFKDYVSDKLNKKIIDHNVYFIGALAPKRILDANVAQIRLSLLAYTALILGLVFPVILLLYKQIKKGQLEIMHKNQHLDDQNKQLAERELQLANSLRAQAETMEEREIYLKKIESKEADLRLAQEIAQVAYYNRNLIHNTWEWSDNMALIFGVSDDYNFGDPIALKNIIHSDDFKKARILWMDAIKYGKTFKTIYRINNGKDGFRYLENIAQPKWEGRHLKYMMGTIQNVTERILVEQQLREAKNKAEQATKAKSNFLATMSHEIRTPLNAVLGMTNLLKITELNAKQRDFVSTIESSGDALLSVINDVLDFSRIESGRMTFEKKWLNINRLVEDALQVVAINANKKQLRVYYILDENVAEQVLGDENRIRQALINFLNNAVKFSHQGHVKIDISVVKEVENLQTLRFAVIDTGIGISKENKSTVFRAFQQADSSVARLYGGSGLGLAITKRLIEGMNGKIGVESKLNSGSTFYFTLPFECKFKEKRTHEKAITVVSKIDDELSALVALLHYANISYETVAYNNEAALSEIPKNNLVLLMDAPEHRLNLLGIAQSLIEQGKKVHFLSNIKRKSIKLQKLNIVNRPLRLTWLTALVNNEKATILKNEFQTHASKDLQILVAEDNPVNQKLIKLIFQQMHYNIDIAENGQLAYEMSEKKAYDIIFMDIQMPTVDGLEATKLIRQSKKIKAQPIVIALTANAMQGQKEVYLQAGMDDYLAKPIDFKLLISILDVYGQKG